jgi:hypothetical protein
MDPKEFQSREADKLANWVSQTLALKEAKVHATDGLAAVGQRSQVQIESHELPDTATPPSSISESSTPLNGGGGLTEEQVREIVREMLEDYATKEWVTEQLEPYATTEWVEEQGYATEQWVEEQNYATEDWVQEQLQPYATQDWVEARLAGLATEAWVEENFVRHDEFADKWLEVLNNSDILEIIKELALEVFEDNIEGYATEAWVLEQIPNIEDLDLSSYATEAWVEENFVRHDEFADKWFEVLNDADIDEVISEIALRVVDNSLSQLGIEAECNNGQVTVSLTGI